MLIAGHRPNFRIASWLFHAVGFCSLLVVSCNRPNKPADAAAHQAGEATTVESPARGVGDGDSQTGIARKLETTPGTNHVETLKALILQEWRRLLTTERSDSFENREKRVALVKEIGKNKFIQAVPVLLQALLNIGPFSVDNFGDFEQTYSCSKALIQIGEPAVPQIQRQFLNAKSGLEQMVLLDVLIKIKGSRLTSDWLGDLQTMKLVPERRQRFVELRGWVLSHTN